MKPLKPGAARILRKLHLYLAVLASLVIIVVAATGFLMTFRDQMLRAEYPDLFPAQVAASDAREVGAWMAIGEAAAAEGHVMIDSVYAPYAAPMPVGVPMLVRHMHSADSMRIDVLALTPNGEVRAINPGTSLSMLPTFLHTALLAPRGEVVVFTISLLMLLGLISGVLVWWPGAGRMKASLAPSMAHNRRLKLRLVHIWIGLAAAPVIALVILTGQATWLMIWTREPAALAQENVCTAPATWAERIRLAERAYPNTEFAAMTIAQNGVASIAMRPVGAHSASRRGIAVVHVDACGRAAFHAPANSWRSADDAISPWLIPVHGGRILGVFGQTLVALSALALLALLVIGLWTWALRPRRAAAKR